MNTTSHTTTTISCESLATAHTARAQLWRLWRSVQKLTTACIAFAALFLATSNAFAQSADLVISSPTVGAIVANTNGTWKISITYTVTNNGTASAAAGWWDLAYLSTNATLDNSDTYAGPLGNRSAVLAAGASYTTTVDMITSTIAPGSYTLILKADGRTPLFDGGINTDNGRVAETNEANNVVSTSITLTRPDLSVGTPSLGTVVANTNGSWTIPITYTVTNNSTSGAAGWYDLAYLSTDATLDNNDYSNTYLNYRSTVLPAGASYTVTANFTTSTFLSSGAYTLFIKTDGLTPTYGGTNTDSGLQPEANEANNVVSSSVTLANKAITATVLSSSVNPANKLQPTLLTATVYGNGIPTGSVTFRDGSATLATVNLSAGAASYSASFTTSGSHSLTAVYSGTAGNPASTSAALQQTVSTVTSTTTALTGTPNPVTAGQVVTLTATVTGNNPSGTVTFNDGSTALGTAPVSAGRAIFAATFATAGNRILSARYGGDNLNTASTSTSLAFTVSATPPGQLPAPPVSPIPTVNFEYDAQGNSTKTVQAPGVNGFNFESKTSYDSLSRVKDTTNPNNGLTRYGYNGREEVTQVTDPRNLVTSTPRDGLGQATQLVSPDTGTTSHTYDEAGNLKTRTDSRGVLATNTYDVLNRLTRTVYSKTGLTTQTFNWGYDNTGTGYAYGIGRLTRTDYPSGSSRFLYDPQGRLVEFVQSTTAITGGNAAAVTATIKYGYDAAGHTTSVTYPSGRKLTITYTDGQPTGMTLAKDTASTAVPLISQLSFAPFGGAESWLWQMGGSTQAYKKTYDTSGRLVRYRLGNIIRDLSYDAADRITAYTHYDANTAAAQASLNQAFGYDANGQLTSITTATASWTISYDANGNRTGFTLNGTPSVYTTEAASNRLTATTNPTRSFGYDSAGNTTSDSANYTATYDAAGRLATITKAGVTTTYSYNNFGQRVRKFSSSGASSTTIFVYDQQGQLLGEYSNTGAAIREYVWLGSTPIAMFVPNGSNPPTVYYFHTDHIDTPRIVTDTAGNIRWRWLAEPFGTTAPETNPSGLGAFTQNLRFPGQYFDQESGLSDNWHRTYDSTIGRYSQSDPIGLDGGINTYAYVEGNPLSYIDSNGLVKWSGSIDIAGFNYKQKIVKGAPKVPVASGMGVRMVLESECVNGKKLKVTLESTGPMEWPGTHIPSLAFHGSVKDLDDGSTTLNQNSLAGEFKLFLSGVGYGSGRTLQSGMGSGGKVSGGGLILGSYKISGNVVMSNPREYECECQK